MNEHLRIKAFYLLEQEFISAQVLEQFLCERPKSFISTSQDVISHWES
jgi:hypothetical protein